MCNDNNGRLTGSIKEIENEKKRLNKNLNYLGTNDEFGHMYLIDDCVALSIDTKEILKVDERKECYETIYSCNYDLDNKNQIDEEYIRKNIFSYEKVKIIDKNEKDILYIVNTLDEHITVIDKKNNEILLNKHKFCVFESEECDDEYVNKKEFELFLKENVDKSLHKFFDYTDNFEQVCFYETGFFSYDKNEEFNMMIEHPKKERRSMYKKILCVIHTAMYVTNDLAPNLKIKFEKYKWLKEHIRNNFF